MTARALPVDDARATTGPGASLTARSRSDLAALLLAVALALWATFEDLSVAAPQALAACAVLLLGRRAERFSLGLGGRLVMLAGCVAYAVMLPGHAPHMLARFLAALCAVSLCRARTPGESGMLLVVALLETALAAALSSGWVALPSGLAIALLAHRALGSWHRDRSARRVAASGGPLVESDDGKFSRRAADRATLLVLALSAPIFVVLPRTDFHALSIPGAGRASEPGVSDEVMLGRLGPISDPDEVVGRAVPLTPGARDVAPYFRCVALERFDGVRWSSSSVRREWPWRDYDPYTGSGSVAAAYDPPRERFRMDAEAGASPRLPLPEHAETITFLDPKPVRVFYDATGAFRPDPGRQVARFQYEVEVGSRGPLPDWPVQGKPSSPRRREDAPTPQAGRLPDALQRELEPAVAGVLEGISAEDDEARAQALTDWVRSTCKYSLTGAPSGPNPVGDFLFRVRQGHCEYFASALAAALREARIPARLVAGYHASRWNPDLGFWVLRRRDAHAWVEAWIRGSGWTRFDATPSLALDLDPYEGAWGLLARVRDAISFAWNQHVMNFAPEAQRHALDVLRNAITSLKDSVPWRIVGMVLMGVGGFVGALWLARRRRRRVPARSGAGPSSVDFYEDALRALRRRGLSRRSGETSRELVARALTELSDDGATALSDLTRAFERIRYGDGGRPAADLPSAWLERISARA